MTEHKRQFELVSLYQRKQSFDVESARVRYVTALEAHAAMQQDVDANKQKIDATEGAINRALRGELPLDIASLQRLQGYLDDRRLAHKALLSRAQRLLQQVDHTEAQLKQEKLTEKAFHNIGTRLFGRHLIETEKREAKQLYEQWLPRYLKSNE